MRRPVTDAERETLMANPELVMFAPQHLGIHPTVFLLVIPVITMVILGALLWFTDTGRALVDAAPTVSCLAFVAISTLTPWPCLHIKRKYDDAYGCDRELRRLLARDLVVERVHITDVLPQKAEVYAESDGGRYLIGIASTRNTFVPDVGDDVAVLFAGDASMLVRPDPRTLSLLM